MSRGEITIEINGQQVMAPADTTIYEAAASVGIEIPTLCHHPDLTPVGSCRLCLVQLEGQEIPVASCTEQVRQGAVVQTDSEELTSRRREILELLLSESDFSSDDLAGTELGRWIQEYDAQIQSRDVAARRFTVDSDPHPTIRVDLNQCILCTRCVRACDEVQGRFVWGVANRGAETQIVAGANQTMLEARCESCGACVAYCPTYALADRAALQAESAEQRVRTTCAYCGVGCQFDLNIKNDRITHVTSAEPEAGPNGMALCVKGRYGYDFVHHSERLKVPKVRREILDGIERQPGDARGEWVDVDWNTALDLVATKLTSIHQESGSDALAFFSSAKCSNEENYLVQKMARQLFGTNNVDHCARLCHSSTVAGLAMAFGSGAMSNSMDDVAARSKALFVIGSNTTEQHPVFGAMLRQAVHLRGIPLIVADPRKIELTEFATLHLRQNPGTDVALLNGIMALVLQQSAEDRTFIAGRCEGFDEFAETVLKYTPDSVSEISGVPVSQLRQTAQILAEHRPAAVIWAMGITQHTTGVMNVLSLANLQMLLGNMGVPGGGVNPLRGQNNVQGACDLGALVNVFPGYQSVSDSAVRQKFEDAWKLDLGDSTRSSTFSDQPGLTITEVISAAGKRDVRGLYILGENPVMTDPDINHVRRCLSRSEFVVLQEIFPSETSEYADVLLPGASFAERDGTFTNTERRIQQFRQAISPPGVARPDWEILSDLASRILGQREAVPTGPLAEWSYQSPSQIMQEIAALTPQYAGVSYRRLEAGERLQWPVVGESHSGTPILHVKQFTHGKGRFHAVEHLPAQELPDDEFPFLMTTGRVLYHWHGGEMTRRSEALSAIYNEPYVEISPRDASRLGIMHLDAISVHSRRGELKALAAVTDRVGEGVLFGNFHFPGAHNVNNVTITALDPVAKIPEYKVCAVRVQKDVS